MFEIMFEKFNVSGLKIINQLIYQYFLDKFTEFIIESGDAKPNLLLF